jgi:hypothetical protein
MKNPCEKNCPNRSPTCHGKCEKYQLFFKERIKENEERHRINSINYDNEIVRKAVKDAIKARRR